MPVPDAVPSSRNAGSPVVGMMVAAMVSIPVWAIVVVAVTYST